MPRLKRGMTAEGLETRDNNSRREMEGDAAEQK
jgi:hypothetical protein